MTSTGEKKINQTVSGFIKNYSDKVVSPDESVKKIKSFDKILVHSNCAFPSVIINALVKRKDELEGVELLHALAAGELPYLRPGMEKSFRHNSFFLGPNSRKSVEAGIADLTPIFLSEFPLLFSKEIIKLDAAIIHVSPPDEHGFCSFGVEVGLTKTGAEKSRLIIAQVNKKMPRTMGDSYIHTSKIDCFVECEIDIEELDQSGKNLSDDQKNIYEKIGKNVASLIEDGATLQMGIGAIPDSVLKFLNDRKDIGIHTELFSDGVIELIESGVINNEKKSIHTGKVIAGFVLGTKKLYNFIDNNPVFEFHPQEYVNDPFIISKNSKMTAINSAIEVDLTGQVCADSIGTRLYSGFGGQLDFIRGASRSIGGKPIIALPSATKDKKTSKIVPYLKQGAGVVTSRADVHFVVTENGVASLYGKTIRERVKELVKIAHPDFQEELLRYAKENKFV
jgi:4-hydroxybutyrate CoA-transferase